MIRLKNVSKFYYSKGMIASGFSKVNLEFEVGEFVVITGESGSGKTTLLNVISGLDSYEEGELYINGRETSHYLAADFEEYRKKYIGNIFQNFNLINSYTVYQNVELILRINGYKKSQIKEKVPAIIERVGLTEYTKTKVSKLSGGQKQRVSIARALAKDTSVVVADEPTGNLDSKSAEGIVQLLSEISKDKLVIVVTHNYDQFASYATRKIKMHDGKVVEDEQITPRHSAQPQSQQAEPAVGNLSAGSKVRLGLRNTFNIIPKFLLLLVVFLFVVLAVTSEYTTFKQSDDEAAKMGYNDFFQNYSQDRIILKKADGKPFTDADYQQLQTTANVKSVIHEDILLDNTIYIESGDFYYDAFPRSMNDFKGKIAEGRMPEKENEVIIAGSSEDYYLQADNVAEILDHTFTVATPTETTMKVKVVGVSYEEPADNLFFYSGNIYMQDSRIEKLLRETYGYRSKVTTTAGGNALQYEGGGMLYRPMASSKVEKGTCLVSEEFNGFYEKGKAVDQEITIAAKNIFYNKSIKLKIKDTYNKKNFTAKTDLKDFEDNDGAIYINKTDYNKLFQGGNYQSTVYVKDTKEIDSTVSALKKMGYETLAIKDTIYNMSEDLTSIVQVPIAVILLVAVFFISYFVIRLILRSRVSYFSILRMLGLAKKNIRRILDIELFAIVNIAFVLFLIVVLLVNYNVIQVEYLKTLIEYLKVTDYVILYAVLFVMSYLISGKFARSLFKKTAMGSFREEA
ncbi:ATP-binding cassette domain-containing protein [Anaerovorax odorimutans]|nr:ATP-binding cassette domain-containing protein [Anaerovorax odorimutans]